MKSVYVISTCLYFSSEPVCVVVTTVDIAVDVESTPDIVSPSVNTVEVLLVPVFKYFT